MTYPRGWVPIVRRVTNAQRAAVCGLVLAGVPYGYACSIVGVTPKTMTEFVARDWRKKIIPPARWTHEKLAELEAIWRDPAMKTETIAELYALTPSRLGQIAKTQQWPLRNRGPQPNPTSIRQQPKPTRLAYRKMREIYGVQRARQEMGLA